MKATDDDSVKRQRNVPGQQRLVVISCLCIWQCHQQRTQILVAINTIDRTGLK